VYAPTTPTRVAVRSGHPLTPGGRGTARTRRLARGANAGSRPLRSGRPAERTGSVLGFGFHEDRVKSAVQLVSHVSP